MNRSQERLRKALLQTNEQLRVWKNYGKYWKTQEHKVG